jgi:tetratricopeptide (TPR) repeat protein
MPLESDEQIHLTVAEGYVELAMYLEADAALDEIDPFCRHLREVLAMRLQIYEGLKKRELMQAVAQKLAEDEPENVQWWISWARSTRRADSLERAKPILLAALEKHGGVALIHFNLACYEAQLGDMETAKEFLARCSKIDPSWRLRSLEDRDLECLWGTL